MGAETICYSLLTCEHPIDGKEKAPSKSLVFCQKDLPAEVFDSFVGEKKLIGGSGGGGPSESYRTLMTALRDSILNTPTPQHAEALAIANDVINHPDVDH